MNIDQFTNECKVMLKNNESIEDILIHLRSNGASKIATIKCLMAALEISLSDSKKIVHLSKAWSDVYSDHNAFQDALEKALRTSPEEE